MQGFPPKGLVDEIIAKKHRPQQLPELYPSLIEGMSLSGGAETGQNSDGAAMARVNRGFKVDEIIPARLDGCRINRRPAHGLEFSGNLEPARDQEVALPEIAQPRAEIESEHPGKRHGKCREAVGIHRQLRRLDALLADYTFDRGASLPFVEYDRLGIEDPPAIAHMRVDSNRRGAPAWIETRFPDAPGRLQAHHVGGGQVRPAPALSDRMFVHKGKDGGAGARS